VIFGAPTYKKKTGKNQPGTRGHAERWHDKHLKLGVKERKEEGNLPNNRNKRREGCETSYGKEKELNGGGRETMSLKNVKMTEPISWRAHGGRKGGQEDA